MRFVLIHKIIKRGLLCAILFLCFTISKGQDASYGQHYSSNIYTNPALTGMITSWQDYNFYRASLHYRRRISALNKEYQTLNFSWQKHIDALGGGVGFSYNRHTEGNGLLTTTQLNIPYSYGIPLSMRTMIRLGIQGSYVQRSIDFSNAFFLRPGYSGVANFKYQSGSPLPERTMGFFNFSWGAVINSVKYYAGFSWHNTLEPNQSFYNNATHYLSKRISIMAGGKLKSKKNKKLTYYPDIVYQTQFLDAILKGGLNVKYGKAVVGYHHALNNEDHEAIFNCGYSSKKYQIFYSLGILDHAPRYTPRVFINHDISIVYKFGKPMRRHCWPNAGVSFPIL